MELHHGLLGHDRGGTLYVGPADAERDETRGKTTEQRYLENRAQQPRE